MILYTTVIFLIESRYMDMVSVYRYYRIHVKLLDIHIWGLTIGKISPFLIRNIQDPKK